jgi:uncharacterized membrane protein
MEEASPLPLSCPECAARMPETAAFCPGCGRPMPPAPAAKALGKVGFLAENIAGALAYFTFIPAIVFLLLEPYKKDRFVRFHSVQCLLVWACGLASAALLKVAGLLLFMIPVIGPLLVVLLSVLVGFAALILWLVLMVKAFQGETFALPVLGGFAEQYSV